MSGIARDDDRRIIPRWFALSVVGGEREFESGRVGGAALSVEPDLLSRSLARWKYHGDDVSAAELCGAALLAGMPQVAFEAASFLRSRSSGGDEIGVIADSVLGKGDTEGEIGGGIEHRIRGLRAFLRNGPNDPIRWADLARAYATIGKLKECNRAMIVAESLGRGSRIVARAATRCFVHLGDIDRARHAITKPATVSGDPWLIAAEIAVSNLQQEASDLFRLGQRVAESGRYHPKALSELRVSLASQEMWFGNRRKGKKLLRLGLEQASENALAQIAWFARRGMFSLDEPPAVLPESPEALAWQHFYRKEWSDSISACERWWRREPFSSRPAELASAIAAIGVRDAALCVAHAEQGLRANPTNSLLWNNVAVGMAYMGRVQEAREALLRGAAHDHPSEIDVVLGATRGLVEFRAGSPDSGRRSYAQAIERAERAKWYRLAMLAKLHLIEEELRLGHNKEEYLPDLRAGADDDDVLVSVLAKRLLEERE